MIKVLIADDQKLFRDLLEHMLKDSEEIEVLASAVNGNEAVALAVRHQPDVILMDVQMPEMSGIEAAALIKGSAIPSKILMLTVSHDEADVQEALDSGVDGYVLKNVGKDELILAVKSVHSGMEVIQKEVRQFARAGKAKKPDGGRQKTTIRVNDMEVQLSERELLIIRMVVEGKSTAEMARALFVTEGRLRNIITELLLKMMVKDRRQLAVLAIKSGLAD